MEIAVNQAEYTNTPAGPVVHLFGREADGTPHEVKITEFFPYFWVSEEDTAKPHAESLTISDERSVSIKGGTVRKVFTVKPGDVRMLRDAYHHYEADIPFTSRFLIDMGITGGISFPSDECSVRDIAPAHVYSKSRVCICDIECDDKNGFPDPKRDPINCICCHDSFDNHYTTFFLNGKKTLDLKEAPVLENGCFHPERHTVLVHNTERELISSFINYIKEKDPDILTGWNFIDFDSIYILERARILGLPQDAFARLPGVVDRNAMRGRIIFDLLTAYKKMQSSQKESYRLDAIAEEELGETKVRYTGTLGDLWNTNPLKMIEYNFKDVELCVSINRKNNIVEFFQEVAHYVGCPLDKTLNSSNVIDIFILRHAHGKFVLPSKSNQSSEEFQGAMVFSPSKGVCENVIVLDLKSLYPMAMMTLNASQETKTADGEIHAPNGVRFKRFPDGLTRSIIGELLTERDMKKKLRNTFPYGSDEYKLYDMQQNVIKIIMNSYYGVSGFPRFRLYDKEIGAAVTSVGRAIIEYTKTVIEQHGFEVIYGDTDSCFVQIPVASLEETMQIAHDLEADLNAGYPRFARETLGAEDCYFSIKFEKIYKRFFQGGSKKRYAGHLIWKEGQKVDKIDITGFETKRSDSSQMTREVLGTVLGMILTGGGKPEIKEFLSRIITDYRAGRWPLEKIGIPGGLNKPLDEYEHPDAHCRGAQYSNKFLHLDRTFGRGSKPKRIYIRRSLNPEHYPPTDVLCFEYPDQIPDGVFEIDWETMLDKTLKAPLTRIFDALGWRWDEFDPRAAMQTALDAFF
ncbi:MAG TPA: DNA-directed DNA polymerase [Methanocorpusculum sp.]|nr:DNA-directed DNA polymerase [Methanocorpusculum sp.]